MSTTFKWAGYESAITALGSELNSLANAAYCAVGGSGSGQVVDNSSGLYELADFELYVPSFGTAPSAGGYLALYAIPSLDGTNYADGGGSVAPGPGTWVGNFPLRAVTGARRVALSRVGLSPAKYEFVVYNGSGQAMASSGNVVKLARFYEQGV